MGRSLGFRTVTRALARARVVAQGGAPAASMALSRRAFLASAAAVAASAGSPLRALAADGRIAIVGGGAAGLTVAYRLAEAGVRPVLFESSGRLGGRMYTHRGFNGPDLFCELGGELVDSNHGELIALADELGVGIEPLGPMDLPAVDVIHFGGRLYTTRDMVDPAEGTGAFLPIAARIAADQGALLTADEEWSDAALALDDTSLADYLNAMRGEAEDWALDLLLLAYWGEFGIDPADQSALNLVDFISAEAGAEFEMFGDSDEAWRVRGGSSSLTDALVAAIGDRADMRTGHALADIGLANGRVVIGFDSGAGRVKEAFDTVVLALPFTRLRQVAGLDSLGLGAGKRRAIDELGYGDNAKVMVGTHARPWTAPDAFAPLVLPAPFSGQIYTDTGFQTVWDTSRGQPGERGVLTNFLTGPAAGVTTEQALAAMGAGLSAIAPAVVESLDAGTVASFFWATHPHTLGSYAGAKVGQYTTLLEATAAPEADGRLIFAGEHTSPLYLGFMNGAVESGERAAAEVLG